MPRALRRPRYRGVVATGPTTDRDIDALMALYTDDAVIESSAVLVLEKDDGGTLRGKDVIRKHFQSFFATRDGEPAVRTTGRPVDEVGGRTDPRGPRVWRG
jgi:ketosteroid isomerase-like protein